ncbi:MAG: deoxycytidine triphosphate deaminase [Crocosphaera sp.]
MTILSDQDIKKELGINIYIYPYKAENLKGASYNLTASNLAWDLSTKESIYDATKKKIIIKKYTTALIETHETIWVSQKIAGTYYSRVRKVSEGTGHISTTLDPNYLGCSLIALHNHSESTIEIEPETDPFVTIIFQYLHTPSTTEHRGNTSGRRELLSTLGIQLTKEETKSLDKDFMNDKDALLKKLPESKDYKEILENRTQEEELRESEIKNTIRRHSFKKFYILLSILLGFFIVCGFILNTQDENSRSKNWYNMSVKVIDSTTPSVVLALIALIVVDIDRRSKE